ncbi:site-2 protease family protein [Thermus caldilimi]|uniref:site-2 protease family protein n=1 Tax=Thermus caldilimi TaxID=2483360 RepID=UPI0010765C76|nr:site-2 protease family protein [Thermus caldilimi]
MLELLVVLLILYLALVVHEQGHLWALKWMGFPVATVALGGPPWVWRKRVGETEYRLGLLPLYAFVKPGERFSTASPWQATRVYLAGPLFSFLGAFLGLVLAGILTGNGEVLVRGISTFFLVPWILGENLFLLFSGGLSREDMGFVAFFRGGAEMVEGGVVKALGFWTVLNMILGWFNLIPLPPLDGGQVWLSWVRGRYRDAVVTWSVIAGLVFVATLMVVALGFDLGLLGR